MKLRAMLLLACLPVCVLAAEDADEFSRANCFNNESITYNYFDPPEWRAVFSWHFQLGFRKHYVTENPIVPQECNEFPQCHLGYCNMPGQMCLHYIMVDTWHGGVHGAFNSSEPNPDGLLPPGAVFSWSTEGVHGWLVAGVFPWNSYTEADDCNLHFEQIY